MRKKLDTTGVPQTLTYDLNGNLTIISNATTITSNTWDAANRLVGVTAITGTTTNNSLFTYDGLSRRVRQIETTGATTNSDLQFIWCGTELCQELEFGGTVVSKLFFPQGEKIGSVRFYYTRDHLGSIREMTEQSKGLRTRYDYDPWGRRVNVNGGDVEADFGFTGHYYHGRSGLHLALYRAYSAELGRWLSRDPIADVGVTAFVLGNVPPHIEPEFLPSGPNIYIYVRDNPIKRIDKAGLRDWGPLGGGCCNKSGGDEWGLVGDGKWEKIPPGGCTGFSEDCDGMTCGGGFYWIGNLDSGTCKTPGKDCAKFASRRWTPGSHGPGARSPHYRGAPSDDPPPGSSWD